MTLLIRCAWARTPFSIAYHDAEWGVPVHDDRLLFEFLALEGAQAGLGWETILRKREGYRAAFGDFDPARVARFRPAKVERLLENPGIVRNRRRIESTLGNAKAFLAIQREIGSFDAYVRRFVRGKPIVNRWCTLRMVPARSPESDAMSADDARATLRPAVSQRASGLHHEGDRGLPAMTGAHLRRHGDRAMFILRSEQNPVHSMQGNHIAGVATPSSGGAADRGVWRSPRVRGTSNCQRS